MPKIIIEFDPDTQVVVKRDIGFEMHSVLDWNRALPEPLIKIGTEYAVAKQVHEAMIAAAPPVEPLKPIGVLTLINGGKAAQFYPDQETIKKVYDSWNRGNDGFSATYIYGATDD